jgi:hypothetical protein
MQAYQSILNRKVSNNYRKQEKKRIFNKTTAQVPYQSVPVFVQANTILMMNVNTIMLRLVLRIQFLIVSGANCASGAKSK